MDSRAIYENDLNLKATELRLGLPGTTDDVSSEKKWSPTARNNKRNASEMDNYSSNEKGFQETAPPSKTQVVGWPPVRSYRRNVLEAKKNDSEGAGMFVKVSMDGAPYLRKVDLKVYKSYPELLKGLRSMFKCNIGEYSEREGYNGSEFAPTYEDRDGDWMLVGDVPWDMFSSSCKRLRIMKGSEAQGLHCL